MYRVFLFCVMSAVVFGDNDEAKYIDLLPEAEKQEFLNRIARRIIEEIQAKDAPQQPHAEVSDDQLNAHHTYVQDIIKEESESLRNERRNYDIKDNDEIELKNDNFETQKILKDKIPAMRENNEHIDLTLRNDKRGEENNRKSTEDSKFSVIPVKVIYDDNINGTESPTYKTTLLHSDSEQNVHLNTKNSHFDSTKTPKVLNESSTSIIGEEDKNVHRDASLLPNSSKVNKNNDDSFENLESSTTNIYVTSNGITSSEDNSITESNNPLNKANTNPSPLTIATTQSNLKDSIHIESQSSRIYVTTEKSAKENQIVKSDIENDIHVAQSAKEVEVNSVKNSAGKGYLRTRLEIQLEENKFEEASGERKDEATQRKNNNIKQYYVYEVPEERPIFTKVADIKEKEQPYVVPIYNFEPKNAYYNAYNNFGINNDKEEKSIREHGSILDKELNLRSGFNIDLKPTLNMKDKKGQFRHLRKHPRYSQVKYILNSKFKYDPNINDYENNENLKHIIKRDNFKEFNWYNDKIGKLSEPPRINYIPSRQESSKIPSMIKYIPLKKRPPTIPSIIKYMPLRKRNEIRKGTSRRKYKRINTRDKLRMPDWTDGPDAGKTFLYVNKNFAHLQPRNKPKWRNPQRTYDGGYDLELDENNVKSNNIDFDYYFGRYDEDSKSREVISDEETLYDFTNKLGDEHYRVEGHDCGHDCMEMDMKKTRDLSEKYLETLLQVLKDMIYRDNRYLVNYNWLLSTVDLESAIRKLIDLIETIEEGNKLHRLDLQLLNYILHLYNTSNNKLRNTLRPKEQSIALQDIDNIVNYFLKMVRRRISLPKNRNRRPGDHMNNAIQIWNRYYIRDGLSVDQWIENTEALRSFKIFLNDLQDEMFDLHNALKHISLITTYDKQNWYNDLKNIYLKPASKKQLLRVILHLAASRLFSSIEDTAKEAEEDKSYINNNGKKVRRIQEEFVFVLRILDVIKKTN